MDIRVHTKHMTLADDVQALILEKVEHATRVFDEAGAIDVEVSAERNPSISDEHVRLEITSTVAGRVVRVEAAGVDERAALDAAIEKYERRLRRLKDRLITRHRKGSEKRLNEAPEHVEELTQEDHGLRIDRVKRFAVKPMTQQEAALQMELLGHSFYLFLDADTDRYGVLYRRRGGSLGLIEPQ
ncbi:MAG TPA: ribosome-associated translation inhibitor RaiA [Acidimicrobiia bacterium]|nr:ribosome-associated translation inhibitor RaiA [Acidimicrobiia bacterium]